MKKLDLYNKFELNLMVSKFLVIFLGFLLIILNIGNQFIISSIALSSIILFFSWMTFSLNYLKKLPVVLVNSDEIDQLIYKFIAVSKYSNCLLSLLDCKNLNIYTWGNKSCILEKNNGSFTVKYKTHQKVDLNNPDDMGFVLSNIKGYLEDAYN